MTTATKHQPPARTHMAADAGVPAGSIRTVDVGLLDTLSSKMHCRAPMTRLDPDETPLYRPVLVDGAAAVPVGTCLSSAVGTSPAVETYRCACGFTIDVPPAAAHVMAG
ncbi:MAG: hypothetical protein ABWY04_18255 [Arthrobacter sp.]